MSVALALLAMLIELCLGYPQFLLRAIGHPVTWIGRLIACARPRAQSRNRCSRRAASRRRRRGRDPHRRRRRCCFPRAARTAPLARSASWPRRLLASTLIAQRSLHRHVADVAVTLDKGDIAAGAPRGIAHRRTRHGRARCSRRRPRRDREPGGEFFRRRSSRRSFGSPSPASLAPHSTRRSIPPTA